MKRQVTHRRQQQSSAGWRRRDAKRRRVPRLRTPPAPGDEIESTRKQGAGCPLMRSVRVRGWLPVPSETHRRQRDLNAALYPEIRGTATFRPNHGIRKAEDAERDPGRTAPGGFQPRQRFASSGILPTGRGKSSNRKNRRRRLISPRVQRFHFQMHGEMRMTSMRSELGADVNADSVERRLANNESQHHLMRDCSLSRHPARPVCILAPRQRSLVERRRFSYLRQLA